MKRKVCLIVFIMITSITLVLVTLVPFLSNRNVKRKEEEYSKIISKIEDASVSYFHDHNIEDLNTIYSYDILFLLDTSSSMNGIGSSDQYRLLNSVNSINSIMQSYSNYRYSIVSFNNEVDLVLKLDNYTKKSDVFIKAIKSNNIYQKFSIGNNVYDSEGKKIVSKRYDTNIGSNILEALDMSIDDYMTSKSSNTPLIFILTDGNDIDSSYSEVIREFRDKVYNSNKKNLGIYVIGFDIKNEYELELYGTSDNVNIKSFYSVDEITNIIKNDINNRSDSYIVSVDELLSLGYLSGKLIDPRNGKNISGKVIISSVLNSDNTIICKKSNEANDCDYIFNYYN